MELTDNLSCLGTSYPQGVSNQYDVQGGAEFNAIPIVFYLILCFKKKIQH